MHYSGIRSFKYKLWKQKFNILDDNNLEFNMLKKNKIDRKLLGFQDCALIDRIVIEPNRPQWWVSFQRDLQAVTWKQRSLFMLSWQLGKVDRDWVCSSCCTCKSKKYRLKIPWTDKLPLTMQTICLRICPVTIFLWNPDHSSSSCSDKLQLPDSQGTCWSSLKNTKHYLCCNLWCR